MVYLEDKGGLFDAPLEVVWKYLLDGDAHDKAHTSTRNPSLKPISETSFIYSSERYFDGRWVPESLRLGVFQPLGMSTEMLEGAFAGSKMFYLYTSRGRRTGIDVFGDFKSDTIPPEGLLRGVRNFLAGEYRDDTLAIRAFAPSTADADDQDRMTYLKDVGGRFDAPLETTWKYFFEGGEDHDRAHPNTRNFKFRPVSENVSEFSSERNRHGGWVRESVRMTNLAPLGYVFEMLEGPISGSKLLYVYIPRGRKTRVDVYGYLASPSIPQASLKKEVLRDLDRDFKEDAPVLKKFAREKGKKGYAIRRPAGRAT